MSPDDSIRQAPPVLGLVLAGGHSRRFGRDKAGITVEGRAVLERMVDLLDRVVGSVFVSVRADQVDEALRRRYALVVDAQPELGPAGGILAAHASRPAAAWLVTACDMPLLDETTIRRLIEMRQPDKPGIGYRNPANGLPEPLCAIWEPATLDAFRRRADSGGSLSARGMLADARIELIDAADARTLVNVNTQADLDRLRLGESDG